MLTELDAPKLTAANLAYLEEALKKSPQDYGFMGNYLDSQGFT
jgi:hypothetical protein